MYSRKRKKERLFAHHIQKKRMNTCERKEYVALDVLQIYFLWLEYKPEP